MPVMSPPTPPMSGAMSFIQSLAKAGVQVCFANPGTTEMHLVGALDGTSIRPVLGLHETVCSGAADGYGRMTGRPAMVLLHLGPGLANSIANLHNARRAGSPVVVVVGDMAECHSDSDAPLCMDIAALSGTVSKLTLRTSSAAGLHLDAERAVKESLSFGGVMGSRVVTVVVPHNQQWEKVPSSIACSSASSSGYRPSAALITNGVCKTASAPGAQMCPSNGCSSAPARPAPAPPASWPAPSPL